MWLCNGVEIVGGKLGWFEIYGGKLMIRNCFYGGECYLLIYVVKYEYCF